MPSSKNYCFLLFLLGLTLASCNRQAAPPANPRIAIVAFDDQSTAREAWLGQVLSQTLLMRIRGATLVSDSEGWRSLGVGRFISGHYRKEPKGTRIHAQINDAQSSATLAQYDEVVGESDLLAATGRIAQRLTGTAPEAVSGSQQDWIAFAKIDKTVEALAEFQKAHPTFTPAFVPLAEALLRSGKKAELAALVLPSDADPLTKAQIRVLKADSGAERLAGLKELVALRPGDVRLLADLGTLAAQAGDWALAAAQYRELSRLEPMQLNWWNSLGYAEANQLKLTEAVAALNEYRRLAPNEPNAVDSLGEVHYMNRSFKEAVKFFDEQAQRFPTFQNGVGLRKAALASYFAGDLKGADQRFGQWVKLVLANAAPSAQGFQQAMWLARTGRAKEGLALLAQEEAGSSGERKWMANLHLAMMRFGLEGTRPSPQQWQDWGRELTTPNLRNEVSVFALLVQPGASKERIAKAIPQPQLAQLRNELMGALDQLAIEPKPSKPKLFPLPNAIDTPIDALLPRSRLAVLP